MLGLVTAEGARATRLLTSLAAGRNALDFGHGTGGFLVVETNFRVYAYTASALQIATLALFVHMTDRFPNMVYGQLTAESVVRALACGITADQIVQYLQANAHPCLAKGHAGALPYGGVPFTVIDQIRLWELDRRRLRTGTGVLYQQFLSEADYAGALEEARRLGAVLYAKPGARLLIVSEDGHEQMRAHFRARQQRS